MEALIKQQSSQIKIIQKVNSQITKDNTARKTKEYGESRLLIINNAWNEVEKLNAQIETYKDQNPQHKYFAENYYTKIETLYEQSRDLIEDIIRDGIERKKNSETIAEQLRLMKKQAAIIDTLQRCIVTIEGEIETATSTAYLVQKIKLLNDYWEHIVENHGNIMSLGKFKDEYFDESVFPKIEDSYQTTLIKLQEKLELATSKPTFQQQPLSNQNMDNHTKLRLPRINIPNFNGDYLKWQSFRDLFAELIHKDEKMANAEKLFYLRANLIGEPNELIQHLSITNRNYETAWDILNKRYDNKRTLVSAQLRTLLNQTELLKESADGLKKLHDTTTECLEAIKNLGIDIANWDSLVIYLLTQKLDKESRRIYEQTLKNPREVQTIPEFLEFVENRFQGLEAIEPVKQNQGSKYSERKGTEMKMHHGAIGSQSCVFCKGDHKIYSCDRFTKLNTYQRNDAIRKARLCINCLGKAHSAGSCKSWRTCKICNKKHHTLLHQNPTILKSVNNQNFKHQETVSEKRQNDSTTASEIVTHLAESQIGHSVLLATAMIHAISKYGGVISLRALIDQGAQATFITEDAAQQLQLKRKRIEALVTGIGDAKKNVNTCTTLTIKPRFPSTFSLTATALVLKRLTKLLPSENILPTSWSHTKNLILADPNYDVPGRIDLILGADVFGKIIMANVLHGPPGSPVAQQTELGWILSGEVHSNLPSTKRIQCCISEVDINDDLRKFWEIEEVTNEKILTSEDLVSENHFRNNYRRGPDGRYIVRIPFKENPEQADLGNSRELALARLFQMEKKFKTNKTFEIMYKDFMKEYLQLGHMVPATTTVGKKHYLPHHAVIKNDSTTSKLRVVFDASAKHHHAKSLNEIMMVGPQTQQNLTSILTRWRKHKIVFTADIEKMYRQIKIDIRDQEYQRILWRNSPDEPIREYNLTTITYGTAAAPFLAIRTLQQLARDNSKDYPVAERIILHDTYVDDVVSGGNSTEEAIQMSNQLINSLKEGGFNLRKWTSNSRYLLHTIPWQLREASSERDLDQEKTIKALGVHWNPATDKFRIQVHTKDEQIPSTKRELLSEAAKIFDPIGLLAPITIKIKLLFQELWTKKLEWDEKLPEEIKQRWKRIKMELPDLTKLPILRWIGYIRDACHCELHGFCDASEKAYSAVIYSRIIQQDKIIVTLLTAKTKVAPLKSKLSLPRLELCGASLLARLLKETRESLEIQDLSYFAWTDSKIVISWIMEDAHRWKTFVGNRVSEIQSLTENKHWFHVRSSENPADIASRGIFPSQLRENLLWWEGPRWLKDEKINYHINETSKTDLERRKIDVNTVTHQQDEGIIYSILQRYSSLKKMQNILAYCLRFIKNLKTRAAARKTGSLEVEETENALLLIVKAVQQRHFNEELRKLNGKQEINKTSRLISLTPFLDSKGIIRVGGRLENANLTFDQKHPMILPYKNELTTLIIDEAHMKTLHGGNALTLEVVRQKFWILNGLKAVKGHIHNCVRCHRYKAQMSQQMMGMLPKARVAPSRPFTHTGVDYAGPFEMLVAKGRGNKTCKGYLAVFVCLTTKAIHIEVVSDLTSKAFIAALRRLVGRRGPVSHLYSDNATNFVGASKLISDLHHEEKYKIEVNDALKETGTQWHFIPPSSPHFGGLWEAGVKSIKHHMRRVIGETRLTFEEMCTLMAQIEACLNSRPLCPLSEDPESLDVLTPGHFLTGSTMLTVPERSYLDTNYNPVNRWDRLQRMNQDFWNKWSVEYIGRLQHRPKWNQRQPNITIGKLVLVKDEQQPPSRWALGRVIETHSGPDGLIRVVTLKMKNGKIKRPISKISLLPVIDNEGTSDPNINEPEEFNNDSKPEQTVKSIATNVTMIDQEVYHNRNQHNRKRRMGTDEQANLKISARTRNLAHSSQGKILLEANYPTQMKTAFEEIRGYLRSLPTDLKNRAFNALEVTLKTEGLISSEICEITKKWCQHLTGSLNLQYLLDFCKNPFPDIKVSCLSLIKTICGYSWGVVAMRSTAGFIEYLLDRRIEFDKDARYVKYEIISILAETTVFSAQTLLQLKRYVEEGPHYVEGIVEVAVDGS